MQATKKMLQVMIVSPRTSILMLETKRRPWIVLPRAQRLEVRLTPISELDQVWRLRTGWISSTLTVHEQTSMSAPVQKQISGVVPVWRQILMSPPDQRMEAMSGTAPVPIKRLVTRRSMPT